MPSPMKKSESSTPGFNKLIEAEISRSGLKVGGGFHQALEAYTKYYKIKGKKAVRTKTYLAKAAINIAKNDKGIFTGGVISKILCPCHLQAAAFKLHPLGSLNDPCIRAVPQIERMEGARPKGSVGQLSPRFSKYLDELK
jgi:hypothetical protein